MGGGEITHGLLRGIRTISKKNITDLRVDCKFKLVLCLLPKKILGHSVERLIFGSHLKSEDPHFPNSEPEQNREKSDIFIIQNQIFQGLSNLNGGFLRPNFFCKLFLSVPSRPIKNLGKIKHH